MILRKIFLKIILSPAVFLFLASFNSNVSATEGVAARDAVSGEISKPETCLNCCPPRIKKYQPPRPLNHPKTESQLATLNVYCAPVDSEKNGENDSRKKSGKEDDTEKPGNFIPELVKGIVPLLQTILWFILALIIIRRFYGQIVGLIEAIRARIDAGDGVKAGPLELLSSLRPKSSQEQVADADAATKEVSSGVVKESDSSGRDSSVEELDSKNAEQSKENSTSIPTSQSMRSRYFMAEDLALRALQTEIGVPISRALQAGKGFSVDGFFIKEKISNIVEVKFIRQTNHNIRELKCTLERIVFKIHELGWRNTRVILVVVFDSVRDIDAARASVLNVVHDVADIDVRCYSLEELMVKFGIKD